MPAKKKNDNTTTMNLINKIRISANKVIEKKIKSKKFKEEFIESVLEKINASR